MAERSVKYNGLGRTGFRSYREIWGKLVSIFAAFSSCCHLQSALHDRGSMDWTNPHMPKALPDMRFFVLLRMW